MPASTALGELERLYATQLFDRVGKTLRLNELGQSLLPQAVELIERAQAIENAYRRTREVPGGPRTLDVDLIVVGERIKNTPLLTLPHPRAHERAFVLAPWLDIDPTAYVPERGPVAALLAGIDSSGVRRRDDLTIEI